MLSFSAVKNPRSKKVSRKRTKKIHARKNARVKIKLPPKSHVAAARRVAKTNPLYIVYGFEEHASGKTKWIYDGGGFTDKSYKAVFFRDAALASAARKRLTPLLPHQIKRLFVGKL